MPIVIHRHKQKDENARLPKNVAWFLHTTAKLLTTDLKWCYWCIPSVLLNAQFC